MEKLKLYIIEFKKDGTMKLKVYFSNYIIKGKNEQPIIIITYNECILFINNRI